MKKIFIERQKKILRIAIKENNKLEEILIEEEKKAPYPGEIYKGVVKNIVPAIKCAFIDIGYKKNCYMYLDRKFHNMNIKKGQDILAQVVKEGIGKKGAKVNSEITIPGIYCVLVTLDNDINFSKKINDENFKKYINENLNKPKDIGIIVRTNSVDVKVEDINLEIEKLYEIYKAIIKKFKYSLNKGRLFDDKGILGKVLRDKNYKNISTVYVNNEKDFKYIQNYTSYSKNIKLKFYNEARNLFSYYGIEKDILALRNRKIWLPCGGHIIIDKTEAMYVIDVNSAKNIKSNSIQNTAFTTNFQAAKEIVKQIKLRNLSGIIIIDFIDMNNVNDKNKVFAELNFGLLDDKNKTIVYPFTQLNLIQIVRRRIGRSINEYIEENCIHCKGTGRRIKLSYIMFLIKNEIKKIDNQRYIQNIYIELNEIYKEDVKGDIVTFIKNIDALDKVIYLNFIKGKERFKVEPILFKNQLENLQIFKVYG